MNTGSWIFVTIVLIGAGVFAVLIGRRFLNYYKTSLDYDTRDEMADQILGHLRPSSPGPNEPIRLMPGFWPNHWSHSEILRLLEYMVMHGWLIVPNYDVVKNGLVGGTLPGSVALTQNSYEQYTDKEPSSITYNGPTHLGDGDLVNNGTITYEWTLIERDVSKLALSLHREAMRHTGELAQQLNDAAETLSQAVEAENPEDPRVKRTVRWVADLVNNTAAGVISAGLVAAATALLGKL